MASIVAPAIAPILERITREYVEDVLRRHVKGKEVSIKVRDVIGDLIEVLVGLFDGGIYMMEVSEDRRQS